MPRRYDALEIWVARAFEQALADKRLDVADHLLRALAALDPEIEGRTLQRACGLMLEEPLTADDLPPRFRH